MLWLQGYPAKSLEIGLQLIDHLPQYADAYTRGFIYLTMAVLYQWRHEVDNLHVTLQGFSMNSSGYFVEEAFRIVLQGWVKAQQGQYRDGIEQIKRGLDTYHDSGAQLMNPYFLSLLADLHGQAGNVRTGLEAISDALFQAESSNEHWWEAELLRLRAILLLQHDISYAEEAEITLHQALEVARTQGSKTLELRATMSLFRLWQHQGKHFEAIQLLSNIYHWFSEGYSTADLQEARHLLES